MGYLRTVVGPRYILVLLLLVFLPLPETAYSYSRFESDVPPGGGIRGDSTRGKKGKDIGLHIDLKKTNMSFL